MVNYNGNLCVEDQLLSYKNRGFLYGDAVFETVKIVENKILFFEDHYFRLMASMRILRMKIPNFFTMEFVEEQVLKLVSANNQNESSRVRITVFRNEGGFYLPDDNTVSFLISSKVLDSKKYKIQKLTCEVDIFKDFLITKQLLSTLKTNNRYVNILAAIYAKENNLDNCVLLNHDKSVIEVTNGNIFMLRENKLITPPVNDGCINGILRKQILKLKNEFSDFEIIEASISPFDLQKADELFYTNCITGIQPITRYRKKEYGIEKSRLILEKINELI